MSREHIILTNGCFDLLHVGHVSFLEQCRYGGTMLIVGIDSDENVIRLKGRVINNEQDRKAMVQALRCVDQTWIFTGSVRELFADLVKRNHGENYLHYIKGDDRNIDTMDQEDRAFFEKHGVNIRFFPRIEGKSTTETLAKIIKESSNLDLTGG